MVGQYAQCNDAERKEEMGNGRKIKQWFMVTTSAGHEEVFTGLRKAEQFARNQVRRTFLIPLDAKLDKARREFTYSQDDRWAKIKEVEKK